jgi:hypothetical protein
MKLGHMDHLTHMEHAPKEIFHKSKDFPSDFR